MIAIRYTPDKQKEWDDFIDASKNGTFLFMRGYMDYHADRFADHSLMMRTEGGKLLAVLPAHRVEETLASHNGLTYGGVISDNTMTTPIMLEVFDAISTYCRDAGITRLLYKTIPAIYHRLPSEEDRYSLFRANAKLYRRDVLSVVDQANRLPFQERRQRKIKQARKSDLQVKQSYDFSSFWKILEANLAERFGVRPLHSLEEIVLLASRFPDNILLYGCYEGEEMIAGVVLYGTPKTAHVQYISANEKGKVLGALDLLFAILLENIKQPYFDFGISTEDNGMHLNTGLIEQKEGFGARAIVHDLYEIELT